MRRGILPNFLIVFVVAILAGGAYTFLKDMDGPGITLSPDNGRISPQTMLKISMEDPSGIRELLIGVRRNNVVTPFFRKHYDDKAKSRTEEVSVRDANLTDGAFELEIKATDGSLAGFGHGNTRTLTLPMRLDMQPPRISVKTLPPNIRRGGAAVIRYTVDEEVSSTGVLVSGYFVPAYLQKDGSWVCIYPFPYTMTAPEFKKNVELTAVDLAGNITRNHITVMAYERKFRNDKLVLTDAFLENVQGKLQHLVPGIQAPLQCYLTINKNVRAANMETLRTLAKNTAGAMLWNGPFQAMPRAAARAGFADHRMIFYNGAQVGEAYHLGLDLASLRNAEIPAANDGRVVFTGELGIYGNLTLIDHGLGLFTLYSHMNDIAVKAGDLVKKGDILGHTGSTGLAFGDHLHFGVLVCGLEVTPVEWLDSKWVSNLTNAITN